MSRAAEFADYFDRIRERTMRVVACVPPERIDWSYAPERFTIADLMRHMAAIERWMFAENVAGRPSAYHGAGRELADGYDAVVDYMRRMHAEAMEIFRSLSDEQIQRGKCVTPGGAELGIQKWLRAMVEHEVHHRGQLYVYLGILGIETPPLYGLTSEEVQRRSVSTAS
jgi:uncharacterized damage-inducible protein DinB